MNTADEAIVPRTIPALWQAKRRKQPIVMLTAYDAGFAHQADLAGVDILLVGDSLGMVVQGQRDTLSVTLDDMVYHTRIVRRGAPDRLIMADMPFLSEITEEQALLSAGRLLREGGADMVKIEGGHAKAAVVRALTEAGIPVCAHVGLLPQRVRQLGGYRVQGRDAEDAARIQHDAEVLTEAGAVLVLVECVPSPLGARLAESLAAPVIGIGAGNAVDGQVLVLHDALGLNGHPPRFVRDFLRGRGSVGQALTAYAAAVRDRSFPAEHEGYI